LEAWRGISEQQAFALCESRNGFSIYFWLSLSQIKFDLRKSLAELKEELQRSNKLGQFDVAELRLFYLGRELKNGGRSLESLGVGTHNVNVIHVHPAKSASSTWKAAPVPARAATSSVTSRFASSLAAAASRRVGFGMMPPSAAAARPMMAGYSPSTSFPRGSFESFLLRGPAPGPPPSSSNEVIEIDDDDVKVASQPRANNTSLLAGIRSAMAGPRNNEVFNVDDDDGGGVEDADDDVVVVETRPAAKRQRHE
jgi:hypothetical protein